MFDQSEWEKKQAPNRENEYMNECKAELIGDAPVGVEKTKKL